MASGGHPPVQIRIDDASAVNEDAGDEHGVTTSGGNDGRVTPRIGVKLKMPSTQLSALTKAFNNLVEFTKERPKATPQELAAPVRKVEDAMAVVGAALALVHPVDEAQALFKEQWVQKHLVGKERFIRGLLRQAQGEPEKALSRRSSSKSSQALNEARAREAVLHLKKKQLEERQAVELQLESARIEREALEQDLGSDEDDEGRDQLPQLGSQRRLDDEWLRASQMAVGGGAYDNTVFGAAPSQPAAAIPEQNHLLQHILLAQARLPTFKGDLLEFLWFIKAFEEQVESVTLDPRRRLYMLLQQLQGEAHTLVKGCQLTADPEHGYAAAKALLLEKYGNPIQLSHAFKDKLLGWPSVKSTGELRSFCVQLQLCQQVKESQTGMEELDAASTLLRLVSKLPQKLRSSWQTRVVDVELNQRRQVRFEDLVLFVQKFDRARNHPVYGKLQVERQSESEPGVRGSWNRVQNAATNENWPHYGPQPETTAVTNTGNQSKGPPSAPARNPAPAAPDQQPNAWKPPCLFCAGNHASVRCPRAGEWPRKEKLAKLKGLCFGCLKPGHQARGCNSRLKCDRCSRAHPTVLHNDETQAEGSRASNTQGAAATAVDGETAAAAEPPATTSAATETIMGATRTGPTYAVAIAPAVVQGEKGKAISRVVLDSASTSSFITHRLLTNLGLKAAPGSLTIATMTGAEDVAVSVVYGLKITDIHGNEELLIHKAYVVERLPFGEEQSVTADDVARWPHLASLPFDFVDAPIDILLGQDVPSAVAPITAVRGGPNDPYAVLTPFGWSLQGPLTSMEEQNARAVVNAVDAAEVKEGLDRLYLRDFDLAFDFTSRGLSKEDRWWLTQVESSTSWSPSTKHYTVALPTRPTIASLKNNKAQAVQRLEALVKQFQRRPQLETDYRKVMENMIDMQFVEPVENSDDDGNARLHNYVLHHGIYHPRKPGKLRVVFNCAAKFQGLSLNDCLVPGPDLTNSIIGVLIRFRQHAVAFTADVDAMFYQVLVPEEQRDLLRLLWWQDGQEAIYRLRVHLFGAASSPGVANFALRKAAEDARAARVPGVTDDVVHCVQKNFYVDDCLKSVPSEHEAADIIIGLKRACAHGGFNLSKFLANRLGVISVIDKTEWSSKIAADNEVGLKDKLDPLGSVQERVLGVAWKVARDCFVFKIAKAADVARTDTKRTVLSGLSKLYDPLGVAAPVVITARILFRALTKDAAIASWDAPLPEAHQERWRDWLKALLALENVTVPRCYTNACSEGTKEGYQVHVFCDASLEAYAAVAFLKKGSEVSFVLGKARVAPPKAVTIPRLELVAAKLAAELMATVTQELELPISKRVLWSDSTIVLKYLRSATKRFPMFVANRVESILHLTAVEEWRYVPTHLNPADNASRGMPAQLLATSAWVCGPKFLAQNGEGQWPEMPGLATEEIEAPAVSCATSNRDGEACFIEDVAKRYSHIHRFRRAIAVWLRFKDYLRSGSVLRAPFQASELKKAEREALKWLQAASWSKQPESSGNNGARISVPRSSVLHKLSPTWNNGLVCMGARTRERVPIVPNGPMAQLLVKEAHEKQGHLGRNATAARASRDYWIVGLKQTTRKIVKDCRICNFWKTTPALEVMAPLPAFRRQQAAKAFESAGVDYFGPFLVREKSKELTKVYGVLFTCAATRAVHLEMAVDLSSSGFVNALRRFVARRGQVKLLVSDNGTNLEGANEQLEKELLQALELLKDQPCAVLNDLKRKGIDWRFNAPGASHHGGFWERLIRTARRVLQVTLSKTGRPTPDGFRTALCECEAILNNRPLTSFSDDPSDFTPLTPNHLLIGCGSGAAPPGKYDSMAQALRHRWKGVQKLTQDFWKRWTQEYLVLLRERSKWYVEAKRMLKQGDVVLVVDALQPRNYWKMGRVLQVKPSQLDQKVRVVDVQTAVGQLTRPISKVCLLEAEQ